jgi:hypothetical protein
MSKSELQRLKERLADLTPAKGSRHPRSAVETERGREAERPTQIPTVGWKDILLRAWSEVSEANLFLVAGGVTYAILLALFPGLAALVSLYGLLLDPAQIEKQVASLSGILPEQAQQMLTDELHTLVTSSTGALGLSAIIALLLALWSASRGMSGLITALNIAYEENEKRGFFKLNLTAIGLTIGMTIAGSRLTSEPIFWSSRYNTQYEEVRNRQNALMAAARALDGQNPASELFQRAREDGAAALAVGYVEAHDRQNRLERTGNSTLPCRPINQASARISVTSAETRAA